MRGGFFIASLLRLLRVLGSVGRIVLLVLHQLKEHVLGEVALEAIGLATLGRPRRHLLCAVFTKMEGIAYLRTTILGALSSVAVVVGVANTRGPASSVEELLKELLVSLAARCDLVHGRETGALASTLAMLAGLVLLA